MGKKLYIGNLAFAMENDDLGEVFAEVGTVVSAQVVVDGQTGRKRGFGFVEMSTDEEAQAAISALHGQTVQGRQITVAEAKGSSEKGGGSGERRRSDSVGKHRGSGDRTSRQ